MIRAEVHDAEDSTLLTLYLREVPRVGEFLWITGEAGEDLRKSGRASSLEITSVAHWVDPAWHPNTHTGDPIHTVCLYVR